MTRLIDSGVSANSTSGVSYMYRLVTVYRVVDVKGRGRDAIVDMYTRYGGALNLYTHTCVYRSDNMRVPLIDC